MLIFGSIVTVDTVLRRSIRETLGTNFRLLPTIWFAAPFVLVRMIYSALGTFSRGQTFSILDGSNTAYLCMDVLMEIIAISICLASGYYAPALKSSKRDKEGNGEDAHRHRASRAQKLSSEGSGVV